MLKYSSHGEEYDIILRMGKYQNGNLAIQMYCHDENGFVEPFATLTKNLDVCLPENQAYLDTNNLGIEIGIWVDENDLGEYLGELKGSGFCFYPLFEFNLEKVMEHGA